MAIQPAEESEVASLQRRLAVLEEEHLEQLATAHAALAEAQDRLYWLDRWGLDLNAAMRRPGARWARLGLQAARGVLRGLIGVRRGAKAAPEKVQQRITATSYIPTPRSPEPDGTYGRALPASQLRAAPVTDLLLARLEEARAEDLERRLAGEVPTGLDDLERRRAVLSLAVHEELPEVLEATGLTAAEPPADVHAVKRGPLEAGGSLYYADLIADGLAGAGAPIETGMRCLDFGCSSGRAVRVLAAAHPEAEWHGCDPIPGAIEWAREHIEGVEFLRSPEVPPLPYEDASFDRVFAISIWSHFSASAAESWLGEMQRIVKPGGALLLTTHGLQTVAHDHRTHRRTEEHLRAARAGLYHEGHWFWDEFGPAGDHGIQSPDWGTAFLSPEWLLARATPHWGVAAFAPGRVEDNQDMYVLQRR